MSELIFLSVTESSKDIAETLVAYTDHPSLGTLPSPTPPLTAKQFSLLALIGNQ